MTDVKISELGTAGTLDGSELIELVQGGNNVHAALSALAAYIASGAGMAPGVLVASNDAPDLLKSAADYVCDGTADQAEVNTAFGKAAALYSRNTQSPAGAEQKGQVLLTGGRFNFSAAASAYTATLAKGIGRLTEVRAVGCNSTGLFNLASANEHLVEISDMYLEGNYASGGSCAAVYFENSSPSNIGSYPSASPDADHIVHHLFINGFKGSTRHGIVMKSTSSDNRGSQIHHIQMRNIQGNGIWVTGASDGFIEECHIGTITGYGYAMQGGNWKLSNNKSFYCDTAGLYASSGRSTLVGFESQDDATGMYITAEPWTMAGVTIDTPGTYGLRIGSNGVVLHGFSIFNRSGGRYATTTNGIYLDASYTDLSLVGVSDAAARMTNSHAGSTPGARSFVRVSDGVSALWTIG